MKPTRTSTPQPTAAAAMQRNAMLRHAPLMAAISAVLAGAPAYAQKADNSGGLDEVVVTAQKRTEKMQDVPVAILALGTEKLEELHVVNLDDYVKYLPSVSYSRGQGQGGNGQPGSSHVYMRGVVSGANENHSGSQPSVGTYLDEQPVTTIDGTVDVHVYDIARVEVLEGPQGTLYGASSQAGTIRIITNKADPTKFSAGYDLGVNMIKHGTGIGYSVEGFVNLPLSPVAAIRLVGWTQHDSGFIDNVAGNNAAAGIIGGTRNFPGWTNGGTGAVGAGTISNAAYVKKGYNTADTKGGRASMTLHLGDNWTITPQIMGQSVNSEGFFGYDPGVGDLQIAHFAPENSQDSWWQGALTVEGKIADFDVTYAGAFMKRDTHSVADYSDYSFFYDHGVYAYGKYYLGNAGLVKDADGFVTGGIPIDPQQIVIGKGYFQKYSHELRISTPVDRPVHGTFGVFVERQSHGIFEQYAIPGYGFTFGSQYTGPNPAGLADYLSIPTLPNTVWLTDETRVDRDQAAFARVTWDITKQLSATVGYRYYKYDNTLEGFYGYSANFGNWFGAHSGERICFGPARVRGTPCTDLDKRVAGNGHVPQVNLSYKITPDAMVYATYSKGFRPGGVNRTAAANIGPYSSDILTNYELGWKTTWANGHIRWNGSIYQENWNDFQFSFLGPNSVTIIQNGGSAKIQGIESELEWAVGGGWHLSVSGSLLHANTTANYCGTTDINGKVVTSSDCSYIQSDGTPSGPQDILAPKGADLPISPKFKANGVARYNFELMSWEADVQGALVYQTATAPALKTVDQALIGKQPAYALFDLSAGIEKDGTHWELFLNNVLDRRAQISRFEQCKVSVCTQPYVIPAQPRTIGLKFGQKF